jgi:UDP-N-acetylmuramoylalanine--D-glutamate ligase
MDYSGKKVVVMGLGLNGGGLESARFFLKRGADVTVTDLRDENVLKPSIEQLGGETVRYVLGRHEIEDFKKADIVIKNPGVKPDSPFLQAAKHIETDISLFLAESPARLFAVTGTKGKSGTASALYHILNNVKNNGKAYLGGNITVSPLTFLDELTEKDNVVLELSSFQLGDLRGRPLKPCAAVLTAIMADHLDRYKSMEEYIDDKRNIYRGQDKDDITIAGDDVWGKSFHAESKARPLVYSHNPLPEGVNGGWLSGNGAASSGAFARLTNWEGVSGEVEALVPARLLTPGEHQKINLLSAALAAYGFGIKAKVIHDALATFAGVEHRLELFHTADGIRFYNDSAATIPEAAAACIEALNAEAAQQVVAQQAAALVLVTGGTDKNLDFSPLVKAAKKAASIILLDGSGSEKLSRLFAEAGINYSGPFDDLEKAVRCAVEKAAKGSIIALSPGCASFGMFLNEFDRGRKWKDAVLRLTK